MKAWDQKRGKTKIRLSLLQKILLLTVVTLAVPTIWFEVYSSHTVRTMMERQAIAEEVNAIALAADNVDNTARNLVLQTLGLYNDGTLRQLSDQMREGRIPETERKEMNLSFVERSDSVMMVDRVYKMDMRIYAMLITGKWGLFNYNCYERDMEDCIQILQEKKTQNPYMILWGGLLENYDMYHYSDEEYLLVLGKKMMEERADSPVLWLGVMEKAIRKQLFPNGIEGLEQRFLIDEDMRILSSGDAEYIGKDIREIADIELPRDQTFTQTGLDTEFGKAVVACQKLENCPWTLVGIRPYSQILNAVSEVNQSRLLFTLGFMMVFVLIVVRLIFRLTGPLRALSNQMMEFRPGKEPDEKQIPASGGKEVYRIYECYYEMTKNICELMKENEMVHKEKRTIEMQLLQAQIKPHFLFNTLMSIRCAIGNGNTEKASDMTLALSSFLRNTIAKGAEMITLQEELDIINIYIRIQNSRSYQKVIFKADIEPGLEKLMIPKLLLQPLIENSISHGFSEQEKGEILLSARKNKEQAVITVKDDGKGFEVNPLEYSGKGKHFGVYSVLHRLRVYYGEGGSLHYESSHGTIAVVTLPISETGGEGYVEDTDRG